MHTPIRLAAFWILRISESERFSRLASPPALAPHGVALCTRQAWRLPADQRLPELPASVRPPDHARPQPSRSLAAPSASGCVAVNTAKEPLQTVLLLSNAANHITPDHPAGNLYPWQISHRQYDASIGHSSGSHYPKPQRARRLVCSSRKFVPRYPQ